MVPTRLNNCSVRRYHRATKPCQRCAHVFFRKHTSPRSTEKRGRRNARCPSGAPLGSEGRGRRGCSTSIGASGEQSKAPISVGAFSHLLGVHFGGRLLRFPLAPFPLPPKTL